MNNIYCSMSTTFEGHAHKLTIRQRLCLLWSGLFFPRGVLTPFSKALSDGV